MFSYNHWLLKALTARHYWTLEFPQHSLKIQGCQASSWTVGIQTLACSCGICFAGKFSKKLCCQPCLRKIVVQSPCWNEDWGTVAGYTVVWNMWLLRQFVTTVSEVLLSTNILSQNLELFFLQPSYYIEFVGEYSNPERKKIPLTFSFFFKRSSPEL